MRADEAWLGWSFAADLGRTFEDFARAGRFCDAVTKWLTASEVRHGICSVAR
jgi:hypothetical protein